MKVLYTKIVALSAVLCLFASAQVVRPRTLSNPSLRSPQQQEYRTCIGHTAAGDEIRVTFSSHRSTPSNWWHTGNQNDIRIKALIISRSLTNIFRLVTTQYGRIDGMCESESLGNIIDERATVLTGGQTSKNIGYIGTDFALTPGKSVRITDHIQTQLNLDVIAGGGMALCPVQQIVGVRCTDLISLCCAISRDLRPADVIVEPLNDNGLSGDISGNQFSNAQSGVGASPEVGNRLVSDGVISNAQASNGVLVNPAFNGGQNRIINPKNDGGLVVNNPISNHVNFGAANGVQNTPMQNINRVQMGPVPG